MINSEIFPPGHCRASRSGGVVPCKRRMVFRVIPALGFIARSAVGRVIFATLSKYLVPIGFVIFSVGRAHLVPIGFVISLLAFARPVRVGLIPRRIHD